MSFQSHPINKSRARFPFEPPLSTEEILALKQACAPVSLLNFPAVGTIRTLRQHGYVTIVLGGIQITPQGLERLLRERNRQAPSNLR